MRGTEEKTFDVTLGSDEALQQEQGTGSSDTSTDTNITLDDLERWYQEMLQQRPQSNNGVLTY